MQFLEEEILEITEETWNSLLGLEIKVSPSNNFQTDGSEIVSGHVEISGSWEGTVMLHGTTHLTRLAASQIFSVPLEEVREQDRLDSIYELSNIIAGNIKSLLPEPCQLSVPKVVKGHGVITEMRDSQCVSQLYFECHGHPLFVSVWKHTHSD